MKATVDLAVETCLKYDHWRREIARLSDAIADTVCPKEEVFYDETGAVERGRPDGRSCFREAKENRDNWRPSGHVEDPPEPPTLAQLAVLVKDCPSCSRLCELIAARKHARQRWGVAKRNIAAVARRTPTPSADPMTPRESERRAPREESER